jgi:hypothetical protein
MTHTRNSCLQYLDQFVHQVVHQVVQAQPASSFRHAPVARRNVQGFQHLGMPAGTTAPSPSVPPTEQPCHITVHADSVAKGSVENTKIGDDTQPHQPHKLKHKTPTTQTQAQTSIANAQKNSLQQQQCLGNR